MKAFQAELDSLFLRSNVLYYANLFLLAEWSVILLMAEITRTCVVEARETVMLMCAYSAVALLVDRREWRRIRKFYLDRETRLLLGVLSGRSRDSV